MWIQLYLHLLHDAMPRPRQGGCSGTRSPPWTRHCILIDDLQHYYQLKLDQHHSLLRGAVSVKIHVIEQNNESSDTFCYFCMQIQTNEPVYSSSFLLARVHSAVHVCYCYSLLRGRIYSKVTPSNIGCV